MNNPLKTYFCALFLIFLLFPIFADTLYFEDGTQVEGTLQGIDSSGLQIKIPYGSMKFPKEGIKDCSFDEESKAIRFFEQKQFAEAAREYEKLEGAHPVDFKVPLFQYKKALCLSKANQNESAAALLRDLDSAKRFSFQNKCIFSTGTDLSPAKRTSKSPGFADANALGTLSRFR